MENKAVSPLEKHDGVSHFWCPMLGQPMRFRYCRTTQDGLPCHRVVACFEPHFDVAGFLNDNYNREQRELFLQPAKGKMQTVAEALAGVGKRDDK